MTLHGRPRGKIARALGLNVFGNPKYDRLLERKPHGPGQSPKARPRKRSEYAVQLAEKQKLRYGYGFGERQFRRFVDEALAAPGVTGENLLVALESTLANAVWRSGWAASRLAARQLVVHGHVSVDGRRADRPSMRVAPGALLELRGTAALASQARAAIERHGPAPAWLERGEDGLKVRVAARPAPADAAFPGSVQLVVEYYAR
ncbi:MAG: 30S ribosomal protein S4 [Spirochaetales bacterium]|nr:30S ribosomal protein S4 [Spirochaetales bacterium]